MLHDRPLLQALHQVLSRQRSHLSETRTPPFLGFEVAADLLSLPVVILKVVLLFLAISVRAFGHFRELSVQPLLWLWLNLQQFLPPHEFLYLFAVIVTLSIAIEEWE